MKKLLYWVCLLVIVGFIAGQAADLLAADAAPDKVEEKAAFGISQDLGDAMSEQAGKVRKQIEQGARSLFKREPLKFNFNTVDYLYRWFLDLPGKLPEMTQKALENSQTLGFAGTLLILTFLVAFFYSIIGQKRIMARLQTRIAPLQSRIPPSIYPIILPFIHVFIAALVPLVLLGAYSLLNALIRYESTAFRLLGSLLTVWTVSALTISLLRELLTRNLFSTTAQHGKTLFRLAQLIVLFSAMGIILYQAAEAFELREDVLALIRFAVSLSIVLVLFLLLLKKKAIFSLIPDLPQPTYHKFLLILKRYYFPLLFFSLLLGLLWTLGYRTMGRVLLIKIWSSAAAFLGIMALYHVLINMLYRWFARIDKEEEAARLVFSSFKRLLMYSTVLATVLIVLNLLGLLGLLEQTLSFPVFQIGVNYVTLWILIKAALILSVFIFASRLIQAYLDYRIYPAIGVEPGLGYALNTFLQYLLLAIGLLVALNVVGLDLRFLLVFAGAIGIGIGMGLQSIAANIISGFTLIFGGRLRKGDWIEVGGTMGMVTDIFLRATQVRTRDNIEYIIPNSDFISGILINYSLGSPLVRMDVPVGVSYSADPRQVEKILLDAARREPLVSKEKPPVVRFVEFGDNSINFVILIWIDVRTTARRLVRSALYFTIFDELKKADIEIPFPQRDLHIRSILQEAPEIAEKQSSRRTLQGLKG